MCVCVRVWSLGQCNLRRYRRTFGLLENGTRRIYKSIHSPGRHYCSRMFISVYIVSRRTGNYVQYERARAAAVRCCRLLKYFTKRDVVFIYFTKIKRVFLCNRLFDTHDAEIRQFYYYIFPLLFAA